MRFVLAFLFLALGANGASAQNEVYDPEPPRGSAYLRFVNGLGAPVEIRPDFGPSLRLGIGGGERVAAYRTVERVQGRALAVEVREGTRSVRATLSAPADGFVTVIVHAGTDGVPRISTIIEEMNFNRARVRVGFYNAFAGCAAASLRVEPDGPSIFDGVPPGEGRQRTVNPVRAQVRATCPNGGGAGLTLEGLEAGASFSTWLVTSRDRKAAAFLSRDVTTPWRR
jgi:hypothetical protein